MRALRAFGRTSLVLALLMTLLITGAVVFPVARAIDTRTFVPLTADIPFLPPDTPIEVTLGAGDDRTQLVGNGEEFESVGTPNATGMITASGPDGELVAIGVAPKLPGVLLPRRPLNDESSAIGLVFSLPGVAGLSVLEDVMLVNAAYAVPELREAAEAIARQRSEGTNPLELPDYQTISAVLNLFEAADAEIGRRLDRLLTEIDADLSPSVDLDGPRLSMATFFGVPGMSVASDGGEPVDVSGLLPACESGIDDPGLCANDRDGRPCAVTYPGVVVDLDGRDGDAVCIVVEGLDPQENILALAGTNFQARWALVYEATNTTLVPDAMIAPKRWTLPSVQQFAVDLAVIAAETQVDVYRNLIPGADWFARNILGQEELEGDFGERLIERFVDLARSYATPPTTDFGLSVGQPGSDPTGTRFTTYTFGIPRAPFAPQADRWLLSLSMTAISEWVIPGLQLALDAVKVRGASTACHPYNTKSELFPLRGYNERHNQRTLDLCSSVLTLSTLVVPIVADVVARQDDPDSTDLVTLGGEILTTILRVVQDTALSNDDSISTLLRLSLDDGSEGGGQVTTNELLDDAVQGINAILDEEADLSSLSDVARAAVVGILTFALGTTDIYEVGVTVIRQVVERAMKALIPAAGTVATIIEITNLAVEAANILGGLGEVLVKASSSDTQDTYVITVAGLSQLPNSPDFLSRSAGNQSGDTGTTVLVIDVSGSMGDPAIGDEGVGAIPKLDAAREAALALTSVAAVGSAGGASQQVGLVTFSALGYRLSDPTSDTALIEEQLAGLSAYGDTNIDAGLTAALDSMEGMAGSRRVVLLSDGADSRGDGGAYLLSNSVDRAIAEGVRIDTIAFDLQDAAATDLMMRIAQVSGGAFGEAATASELTRVFVASQHAQSGEVIELLSRPMTSNSSVVPILIPGEEGVGPKEVLVTVVLRGEDYDLTLRDSEGSEVDLSKSAISSDNGVTSLLIESPKPGVMSLTVTRADRDSAAPTEVAPAVLDESIGLVLTVSEAEVSTQGVVPELVVVASVSGRAAVRPTGTSDTGQRIAALSGAVGWLALVCILAVGIRIRTREGAL